MALCLINKVSGDSFKECAVFSDVLNQAHPHVFVITQAICKVNDKFISKAGNLWITKRMDGNSSTIDFLEQINLATKQNKTSKGLIIAALEVTEP